LDEKDGVADGWHAALLAEQLNKLVPHVLSKM
jgi:hypothetical protein